MKLLVDQAPGLFFYDTKFVMPLKNTIAGFQYNLNYPVRPVLLPVAPSVLT